MPTADQAQDAVATWLGTRLGITPIAEDEGVVARIPPYVEVSLVSDEAIDGPSYALASPARIASFRRFRVQATVVGRGALGLAQRAAMLWRSDARIIGPLLAAGIGPEAAGSAARSSGVRGGAGVMEVARVDLVGNYTLRIADPLPPGEPVSQIHIDIDPGIDTTLALVDILALSTGDALAVGPDLLSLDLP